MKKRRIFRNLNDKEFAWVLYDVGNSAYTMLACALIPIWFKADGDEGQSGAADVGSGNGLLLDGDRGDHDRGCVAGSGMWSDF